MRRRALLASLGALSAGCLDDGRSGTESPTPTRSASSSPTPTATCDASTGTSSSSSSSTTPPSNAEYELTDVSVSNSTDRPSVRYVLEPSAFYSADAVERERDRTGEELVVRDVSEIESAAVRDAVRAAVLEGAWHSDTLPDGLAETIREVDFFTGVSADETYTHIGLTLHRLRPDRPPAVTFNLTIDDPYVAPEDPGVLVLVLRNRSSRPQQVFSGSVSPFGMVHADAVSGESRFLPWREYEEEGCFSRTDEGGWLRCDIGKLTELAPCSRLTRRYEVLPSTTDHYPDETVPPSAGSYRLSDELSYSGEPGGPESTLSFEATFTLARL